MEAVVKKLSEMEEGLAKKLAESVDDQAKKVEATLADYKEKVDADKLELSEKISTLEAKIAQAPSLIREQAKFIDQDRGRYLLEQFRLFREGKVSFDTDRPLKLYESVEQYEMAKQERKEMRLSEASALTGSGSGKGGMVRYQPFFRVKRFSNNLRDIAPVYATDGSDFQWRVRTGNSGLSFGYTIAQNNSANTEDTNVWQISLKDINTVFPIRSTFLMDTASGGYESVLMDDLVNEQSNFELQSAIRNNDTTGSATPGGLGGVDGLRGINGSYGGANATYTGGTTSAYAFGTSSASSGTGGYHSIATYDQLTSNSNTVGTNNLTYQDLVNVMGAVDINYWDAGNMWLVNPQMLTAIRALRDLQGRPIFIDGLTRESMLIDRGMGFVGMLLDQPCYVNPYLDTPWSLTGTAGTVNKYPLWYGNWQEGYNTVDSLNLILRRYDQTLPGSINKSSANDVSYLQVA